MYFKYFDSKQNLALLTGLNFSPWQSLQGFLIHWGVPFSSTHLSFGAHCFVLQDSGIPAYDEQRTSFLINFPHEDYYKYTLH